MNEQSLGLKYAVHITDFVSAEARDAVCRRRYRITLKILDFFFHRYNL